MHNIELFKRGQIRFLASYKHELRSLVKRSASADDDADRLLNEVEA
jgi:hypothetical protein